MNRRHVLAALGSVVGGVGVAGCRGIGPSGDSETPHGSTTGGQPPGTSGQSTTRPQSSSTVTDATADSETPTPTPTSVPTTEPGPETPSLDALPTTDPKTRSPAAVTPGTPTADTQFPPDSDGDARVCWYRSVAEKPDADVLVMEPSLLDVSAPEISLSMTLHNRTDRKFEFNPYHWEFYRWERGRWHYIAPDGWLNPLADLKPGGSHTWDPDLSFIGGGTYAYSIRGALTATDGTDSDSEAAVAAAQFPVTGPPLAVRPSERVTAAGRDTDRVVLNVDHPIVDEGAPVTFIVQRADDVSAPRHLITEQLYRHFPLRDALAYMSEGVAAVRVRTVANGKPVPDGQNVRPPFAYNGETFRIHAVDRRS